MMDNIKALFERMLPDTKKLAFQTLKEEFKLKSIVYVRQSWIWGEGVPEEKQARVVEIFQKMLLKQEKETIQTINKQVA